MAQDDVESTGSNVDTRTSACSTSANGTSGAITPTGGAGIENVIGGGLGMTRSHGNAGNNTLDGGLGGDTLVGGAGNDTYVVDDAGDAVTEAVNEGTDTGPVVIATCSAPMSRT